MNISKKKIAIKFKKFKISFRHYFYSNQGEIGREREKKILARIPLLLDPRKKIPKKVAKTFEKLKNLFPALFLSKTG